MIKIKINNQEVFVPMGSSVLEACKFVGIDIPRFCYHERLSVAGNCRMCLVEIEKSPKPVASCAMPVSTDMCVFTDSPLVKKSRENVLETLLLNHPLDCPICDQGGECDLQDQTRLFGGDYSRFYLPKRSVEDKYCGPLIKTIMTRCIHCTRCVRFATEIAGVDILGTLNRGVHTEIGAYLDRIFESEISGNVIDLCPVGALTSKPYAFTSRPWELRTVEGIDTTDNLGSNVYVDFKESEIMRIIPKLNEELNQEWISDKARFSYDGLRRQRLYKIYSKENENTSYRVQKWEDCFSLLCDKMLHSRSLLLVGSSLDFDTLSLISKLDNKQNIRVRSLDFTKENLPLVNVDYFVEDVELADCCFLLGCNPRIESSVLNIRLRTQFQKGNFLLFGIGSPFKNNIPTNYVGLNLSFFLSLLEGRALIKTKYKSPVFLIGFSFLRRFSISVLQSLLAIWNPNFSLLKVNSFSNYEGKNFLGIKSYKSQDLVWADCVFFLQLEDTLYLRKLLKTKNKYKIWINSHGNMLSTSCHLLVPVSSILEYEGIYLNQEVRPQRSYKVCSSIKDTRSILSLFKALYYEINNKKVYLEDFFIKIFEESANFLGLKHCFRYFLPFLFLSNKKNFVSATPLKSNLEDFYLSSFQTKASLIMSQCSQIYRQRAKNFVK